MSDDDLLSGLVSGSPQSADQVKAIVQQLRSRGQLADLAQMSGDPTLAPFGARVSAQDQQDQHQLGAEAIQNRGDDIRNAQLNRQLGQGQSALAETIRYHNMEDQERQDKLAQAKSQQADMANSQSTIDKIGQYQLPLPVNRSAHNAAIIDAVSQQYPDYDSTKYAEKNKAQMAFASGKQGDLIRSADVSVQHLDAADQLATGLENTKYPAINSVVNFYKTQTGNPAVAKFNAAKSIVSDEINKFIIGGGGALADREQLQSQLSSANSPDQLNGVTNTLRTLMGGQLKGLQGQFTAAGLGSPDDFAKKLQPRTLGALGLGEAQPGPGKALPGALAAQGGPPPGGSSGPPPSAVPGGSQGPPAAPPGAAPAPSAPAIVRTGRRNGKRVGQLADGTVVPLE